MKIILPIFFLSVSLSSCQTYQYLTVTGSNIKQDSSYQFVAENDTLLVQYNFNGYNGPVQLSVYNKMDKPLYVNWSKSAIISNDKACSFYSPDQQLNGTTNATEWQWNRDFSTQTGLVQATIKGQKGVDFIPPHSWMEKSLVFILNGFIEEIPKEQMSKRHIDGNAQMPRAKTIDFSREASPVNFRTYLTFSTGNGDTDEFYMEHQFYVSQLFLSTLNPAAFSIVQNQGNRFYTSRASGFTKGAGVLAGVGLVSGLVIAAASDSDK